MSEGLADVQSSGGKELAGAAASGFHHRTHNYGMSGAAVAHPLDQNPTSNINNKHLQTKRKSRRQS
jgi:hypothetical protein